MNRYTPQKGYTWNPLRGFPRNSPCPCGSDKKFKSCHRDLIQPICTNEEAQKLSVIIKAAEKGEEITIN